MIRRSLAVLAAALLLAGCGGTSAPITGKTLDTSHLSPTTGSPTSGAQSASVASGGRLLVGQQGTLARNVWYVRIENAKGVNVTERAFPAGVISLDSPIPDGDYRVISWRRECKGTCPTTGDNGLGPLKDVCGARAHVSTGQTVRFKVTVKPDGSCAVSKTV